MSGVKVTKRHRIVAEGFRVWLGQNPNASEKEKIQKLNQLSDLEFMRQRVNRK